MQKARLYGLVSLLLLQFASFGFLYDLRITTLDHPANDSREEVRIGVILPAKEKYDDGRVQPWPIGKTLPAIQYAVDTVNNKLPRRLPKHVLRIVVGDSQCSDTVGPLVAMDMHQKHNVNVFLGPACEYSVSPVARFSPHWNIPLLTSGALVQHFTNKMYYRLLTRMFGPYTKLGRSVALMLHFFGYVHVAFIYANNLGYRASKYGRSNCYFAEEAIYHAIVGRFKAKYGREKDLYSRAFDENLSEEYYNMTYYLKEASKHARGEYYLS